MTVFVIEPARVFRKTWTTTTTTATTATHNKSSNQRTALFSPFAEVLDEHILHAQRRGGWISGVCKGEQQDTAIQFVPCFLSVCGSAHHNRINNKRSGICPGFIPPIFFGFRFVPSDPLTTKVWKRRRDIERDKTVERKVNPVSNTTQDRHEHWHKHWHKHKSILSFFPAFLSIIATMQSNNNINNNNHSTQGPRRFFRNMWSRRVETTFNNNSTATGSNSKRRNPSFDATVVSHSSCSDDRARQQQLVRGPIRQDENVCAVVVEHQDTPSSLASHTVTAGQDGNTMHRIVSASSLPISETDHEDGSDNELHHNSNDDAKGNDSASNHSHGYTNHNDDDDHDSQDIVLRSRLEALKVQEELFGPGHPDLLFALRGLGHAHYRRGNYRQAQRIFEENRRILAATVPTMYADCNQHENDCHNDNDDYLQPALGVSGPPSVVYIPTRRPTAGVVSSRYNNNDNDVDGDELMVE